MNRMEPSATTTSGAATDHARAEPAKARTRPCRPRSQESQHPPRVLPALHSDDLDRDHGQYAGHDIEEEATQEPAQQATRGFSSCRGVRQGLMKALKTSWVRWSAGCGPSDLA
jgi:hypothetical protein